MIGSAFGRDVSSHHGEWRKAVGEMETPSEAISTLQGVIEAEAQDGEKQEDPEPSGDPLPPFSTANLDRGIKYTLFPNETEGKYVGVSSSSKVEF